MSIIALLLAAASPAASCLDLGSTTAMAACLDREAQAADRRLNAAYRAARARIPAKQAVSLQTAQRAWIAFRDANCRAYAAGEGTITQVETAQCRLNTTTARAAELENFAKRT